MVSRTLLAVGLGVVVLAIGGVYAILMPTSTVTEERISKLTWERTGGFAGVTDELNIDVDGFVSYESNIFGSSELFISPDEVAAIMESAEKVTTGEVYLPREGMADFFQYRVTIQRFLSSEQVEWVDAWASEESLSGQLIELQAQLETIAMRAQEQGR